jgi:hypothetical protein
LYDVLDLSTTSGSIRINVEIQPGDKPAVLRLATQSGSVRVHIGGSGGVVSRFRLADSVSKRTFQTDIQTQSGSVGGSLVHGNGGSTSISTASGSMTVTLYTVGVSGTDADSTITTTSNSGSQRIALKSEVSSIGTPVRAVQANHVAHGSASIYIDYSREWEGTVHTRVLGSGSLGVSGRNLETQCQGRRECWGRRGNDAEKAGRVEVLGEGSGSLTFSC